MRALARFEELGGQLTADEQAKAFLNLTQEMRKDVNDDAVLNSDLSYILLFEDVYKNA